MTPLQSLTFLGSLHNCMQPRPPQPAPLIFSMRLANIVFSALLWYISGLTCVQPYLSMIVEDQLIPQLVCLYTLGLKETQVIGTYRKGQRPKVTGTRLDPSLPPPPPLV